ncbi:NAD-binding protein, partial [bacterium]|nr:NAD-binding protein [bacterium]
MMASGVEASASYRRLGYALLCLAIIVCLGTLGLIETDKLTPMEAFYMIVITLSTVGFGEIHPLSDGGRLVIIVVIVCGVAIIASLSMTIGSIVVEGHLRRFLGGRMMRKELDKLSGHYIVCGYGRMGRIVSDELLGEGIPHVIVTDDADDAEDLQRDGRLVVHGDATEDEILEQAGVKRARGLVASVSSDVANLYITLSARELSVMENPDLFILSRADDDMAIRKLKHAGANRVVSPYQIGGSHMALALLRPTVYDYLEVIQQRGDIELGMEELRIGPKSAITGRRLRETPLRQEYDVIVIGMLGNDGKMVFNPGPEQKLADGDRLIVLGG